MNAKRQSEPNICQLALNYSFKLDNNNYVIDFAQQKQNKYLT